MGRVLRREWRAAAQARPHAHRARALPAIAAIAGAATIITGVCAESAHAAPAPTVITSQASASGFPVGVAIFDSATLGRGVNPTGTITFLLFGPADPGCAGSPLFTASVSVSGNALYQSQSFVTTAAGTYRWVARYSGDANNTASASSCADAGAAVAVAKRTPTLNATASLLSLGGPTTDTATINGAAPTGTITFTVFGPGNLVCAGPPVFTSTKPVSGNGSYTSNGFTPSLAGTYQWIATYSGDANNNAAGTICADLLNSVVATGLVSFSVVPVSVAPAAQLSVSWNGILRPTSTDWIALYSAGAPDWAVRAWRYTNGATAGSTTLVVPFGTPAGQYDVRLFANNSYTRLASSTVTVS